MCQVFVRRVSMGINNEKTKYKYLRKDAKMVIFPDLLHAIMPSLNKNKRVSLATQVQEFFKICLTDNDKNPFFASRKNEAQQRYLGSSPKPMDPCHAELLLESFKGKDNLSGGDNGEKLKKYLSLFSEDDKTYTLNFLEQTQKKPKPRKVKFEDFYYNLLITTLENRAKNSDANEYHVSKEDKTQKKQQVKGVKINKNSPMGILYEKMNGARQATEIMTSNLLGLNNNQITEEEYIKAKVNGYDALIPDDLVPESLKDNKQETSTSNINLTEAYVKDTIKNYDILPYNNLSIVPEYTKLSDVFVPNNFSDTPFINDSPRIFEHTYSISDKSLLEDIILSNEHIAIIGAGGIGKSTYLRYMLLLLLKNYSKYHVISDLIECKSYFDGDIKRAIDNLNNQKEANDTKIIFIDAVDEAKTETFKRAILNEIEDELKTSKDIKFIISARSKDCVSFIQHKLKFLYIDFFNKDQIKEYVNNICRINGVGNYYYDTTMNFDPFVNKNYDVIKTPLFLILLIRIYQMEHTLPSNKIDIFEKIYDLLYKKYDDEYKNIDPRNRTDLDSCEMLSAISCIAYYTFIQKKLGFLNSEKSSIKSQISKFLQNGKNVNIDILLDDLTIAIPFLRHSNDINHNNYEFIYNTFHEYFTANFYYTNNNEFNNDINFILGLTYEDLSNSQIFDFLYEMYKTHKNIESFEKEIILPLLDKLLFKYNTVEDYIIAEHAIITCPDPRLRSNGTDTKVAENGYVYEVPRHKVESDNMSRPYVIDYILHFYNYAKKEPKYEELTRTGAVMNFYKRIPAQSFISKEDYEDNGANYEFINDYEEYNIIVKEVLHNKSTYEDLYSVIFSNDSPYVKEYYFLVEKLQWLKTKYK